MTVDELKELLGKVTPGPWYSNGPDVRTIAANVRWSVADAHDRNTAALIALSPQIAAALIEAMEGLRKVAAFDDIGASEVAEQTGSYWCFDEPASVQAARAALSRIDAILEGKA